MSVSRNTFDRSLSNDNKEESEMKPVFKDQSYNKCDLENVEIEKYSRQMILTEIGACLLYTSPSPRDRG